MSFDTDAFRKALGCFPTGVAVVTASMPGGDHTGITVNSFTAVSLEPPLVLWCINKKSNRASAFAIAKHYTISLLGTTHLDASAKLAKEGSHSLDGIDLLPTQSGPPALADALAYFECESEATHEGGDHIILIGRVVRFARHETGDPLIFFKGRYGAISGNP
ncbi:MAG TPA: flavin reductase family protein [Rhizomicrobium sp.]